MDSEGPFDTTFLNAVRNGTSGVEDVEAAEMLVDHIAAVMVAVSTGGPAIEDATPEYQRCARALRAVLQRLDIDNPNRFSDLWQWYGRWSDGTLPTYASRRSYIADLYAPVRDALETRHTGRGEVARAAAEGQTGWSEVDTRLGRLQRRVRDADNVDDYKAVGLQCISVFEALGRACFDTERHLPDGEEEPHQNDFRNRVGYFMRSVAQGERFEHVRKMARGAWSQSQAVKHRDEPNVTDAGIAADACALLVAIVRRIADEENEQRGVRPDDDIPF